MWLLSLLLEFSSNSTLNVRLGFKVENLTLETRMIISGHSVDLTPNILLLLVFLALKGI